MEACNHSTFSQVIISSESEFGITFHNIISIVSDIATYCMKAFKDVLSAVYPKSVHILCLAHIVNLSAEDFRHHNDFTHTSSLIAMIKSSLSKKKQAEKSASGVHE